MRQKLQTAEDTKFHKALENMWYKACAQEDIAFLHTCTTGPGADKPKLAGKYSPNVSISNSPTVSNVIEICPEMCYRRWNALEAGQNTGSTLLKRSLQPSNILFEDGLAAALPLVDKNWNWCVVIFGVIKLDFTGIFQVLLSIESTVVWVNRTGGRHGMQYVRQNFYAVQTCLLL